jgi:hypothetical protein
MLRVLAALLFLCSLFAVASDAPHQTVKSLRGQVVDKAGHLPVPNAFLWIRDAGSNNTMTLRTDPEGKFSADLKDGVYDVLIGAVSFAPVAREIQIRSGKPISFTVALGPSAYLEQ